MKKCCVFVTVFVSDHLHGLANIITNSNAQRYSFDESKGLILNENSYNYSLNPFIHLYISLNE